VGGALPQRGEASRSILQHAGTVINLAIIDSSRMFADVLATRLGAETDMRVLRSATGPDALRQAVSHSSADVVLGDVALFDPEWLRGPEAPSAEPTGSRHGPCGDHCRPAHPSVILLVEYEDGACFAAALRKGVRGFVPRDATVDELISAIHEAADGGTWIRPKALTAVLDELNRAGRQDDPAQALLANLTPREREVLACLVDGLGRKEVAKQLNLSTNTVRTHVQSILSKLDVSSCVAAVALVRRGAEPQPVLRVLS